MDQRIPLQKNARLNFGETEYIITDELARGGSSIVYNAFYVDNIGDKKPVRIKECYPFKYSIRREKNGALTVNDSEKDNFDLAKKKLVCAYKLGNEIFTSPDSTNYTANTYNIYEANNTVYIVSAFAQGKPLSERHFNTLKDCISVVKSTANAIMKLHSLGYLYLDIKPDNVFTLDGTTELIQLFDFDTLLPVKPSERSKIDIDLSISYTRGFAPIEQQMGNFRRIGKQCDVYGIGALLFWMMFGRTPNAQDCESDAVYDFSSVILRRETYRDSLFFRFTDFFHGTLATYYLDRFSGMETVVEKLDELQKMADSTLPFIHCTKVNAPVFFVGRDDEISAFEQLVLHGESNCTFVCGMGGIGKSTLVRTFISRSRNEFETVVYVNYKRTVMETFTDDFLFEINTLRRDSSETQKDYFIRKLTALRELARREKILIVFDNYTGDRSNCLSKLIALDIRIICISRSASNANGLPVFKVGAIADRTYLYQLFEKNLGNDIAPEEICFLDNIIRKVAGHTLVLELIARQIAASSLTLSEASELVDRLGFADINDAEIAYSKDFDGYSDTIRGIINGLFERAGLSSEREILVKIAALFGDNGISADIFYDTYPLSDIQPIFELKNDGWLYFDDDKITMHPVVIEAVSGWIFSDHECNTVFGIMAYFSENTGSTLSLAEALADGCEKHKCLSETTHFKELLCRVMQLMPRERELEYTLPKAENWLIQPPEMPIGMVIDVYDLIVQICCEHHEFERAAAHLKCAKKIIRHENSFIKGRFWYILAGYYDSVLDGNYDAGTTDDERILRFMLRAIDKSAGYMKRAGDERQIAEILRFKAIVLIRSGKGSAGEITKLLTKIKGLLDSLAEPDILLERDFYMVCAWFLTYYDREPETAVSYLESAYRITENSDKADIDKIDETYYPIANVYFELGDCEKAAEFLENAVALCDEHKNIKAYLRKKTELYGYLLDVYSRQENIVKCREIAENVRSCHEILGEEITEIPQEILNIL